MAKPRHTLSMDIDLAAGGFLRLELDSNGLIRRQQVPAVNQFTDQELLNIQAVESAFIALADLIDKLTT